MCGKGNGVAGRYQGLFLLSHGHVIFRRLLKFLDVTKKHIIHIKWVSTLKAELSYSFVSYTNSTVTRYKLKTAKGISEWLKGNDSSII